ncbi:MAG: insulinase family protein [Robiginitomaculum sp.]|nr:insulinase family protein [Robiginitomaculum sp.]
MSLPLLYMSWPTVHANHKDEAPLDVLMDILGSGKTSLLYKNMVKNGKAVQANAGHACGELSCTFTMLALPTPGTSLAELETIARASLVEFEERGGANDDDITRVKAGIVSGMIYGLESVPGKVRQLAAYQTYRGNPNEIKNDISRYENVSKVDVTRVYNQYIKGQHAVIMSIVPKGAGGAIVKPDTWKMYERNIPTSTNTTELTLRPGTSDFDRSIVPAPGPNPAIKLPAYYKTTLSNGINVIGTVNDEVPTTTISIRLPVGQTRESLDKLGLASLTAAMMDEATQSHSAEELSNQLAKIGSTVSFGSGDQYTTLNIRTLTKNLDETMAIAMERLTTPKFDQADFSRLQKQTIEGIKNAKKNASATATQVFTTLLFGVDNSFSYSDAGTIKTVSKLSLEDVKNFYAENYGADGAAIMIVSDLQQSDVAKYIKPITSWQGKTTEWPSVNPFPKLQTGTLYFIDKPDAAQSEIRIGKRALNYDSTGEYYRSRLMNYNLGGAFNSRINLNLREDKGYTYGARSFFYGNKLRGAYRAQAGVRADTTAASIIEFVKEINDFQTAGMNDTELSFMKNSLGQRDARSYETPRQKLGFLSEIMTYDLPKTYIDDQNAILKSITKDELNGLASKHLKLEDMIMVVMGDKAKIMGDVKALGYPIVEIDADGNPVK